MSDFIEKAEGSAIVKKYTAQSVAVIEHANHIKILTDGDMAPVADFLAEINKARTTIKNELDPIIADAHGVHKRLTTMRASMLSPYDQAEGIAKDKVSAYLTEQERKRREEQARLERERQEAERKERERLEKLAEKQMDNGKFDKAEETIERAESVYIPMREAAPVTKSVKTENGGMTSVRDIEVVSIDPRKFIAAVLGGTAPISTVTINQTGVKKWIKDYGIDLKQLEAVGVVTRETVSVRRIA